MSDKVLGGIVRPGPPPLDAIRPEAVIRTEDGRLRRPSSGSTTARSSR
jgi:hypothetical protein